MAIQKDFFSIGRKYIDQALRYVHHNPQMGLSVGLFCVGYLPHTVSRRSQGLYSEPVRLY
jgi:hypothetical protein